MILDKESFPIPALCPYIEHDVWNGDWDCKADTILICEECKYGKGRKDPLAKRNKIKEEK